jgi:hypothetical protein
MNRYDESLAILKGQIDTHQQKIDMYVSTAAKHMLEIDKLEQQKRFFEVRISNLNEVIEDLLELKAKSSS